jgi:hypothetical protein
VAWIGVVPVVQAAFNEAGGHSEVLALDRKITERFLSTHFLYVQNVFYCKSCIVYAFLVQFGLTSIFQLLEMEHDTASITATV